MDITAIIKIVIEFIVAIASLCLIPWLRTRFNADKVEDMLCWVDIAVKAAEQIHDSTQGSSKKVFVLEFLHKKGFDVDETELDFAIEAAVLKLHRELTE